MPLGPPERAPDETEQHIRRACDAGDYDAAVRGIIGGYGAEINGFLHAMVRDPADASEVFADFTYDVLVGVSGFRWRCSARGWAYTVARNAAHRFCRGQRRERDRRVSVAGVDALVARATRTPTPLHLQSEVKQRVRALRDGLSPDEQTLLILRVDKGLPWRELAMVMGDADAPEQELTRHAARLRKRFQLIKQKLRVAAAEQGLLDG